jgi:hypothetical protein
MLKLIPEGEKMMLLKRELWRRKTLESKRRKR